MEFYWNGILICRLTQTPLKSVVAEGSGHDQDVSIFTLKEGSVTWENKLLQKKLFGLILIDFSSLQLILGSVLKSLLSKVNEALWWELPTGWHLRW